MGFARTFLTLWIQIQAVWGSPSAVGSCGAHASPDCVNDMGSCGNACCSAEFSVDETPGEVFNAITSYLQQGGSDGLFAYVGGAGGLAGIPGDWTSIFQGKHQTYVNKYNDTLDFAVRPAPQGGSKVRVFSISDIAGALGDMGQNHRTVSLLGADLKLGAMTILFGCGSSPSVPASSMTAMASAPASSKSHQAWMDRAVFAFIGAACAVCWVRLYTRHAPRVETSKYALLA